MIKQKGFQDYLNDDPSLKEKVTYEELIKPLKGLQGDDFGLEEVLNVYTNIFETLE